MDFKTSSADIRWWLWVITLVFIVAAVAGWTPGYYATMAVSAIQVLFFLVQEKSFSALPTQVRLVYFAFTLFGLWPEVRWYAYALLLVGTVMVTFFGRCAIALMLKQMPWNRERELRLG
jgi:hypothetical protein